MSETAPPRPWFEDHIDRLVERAVKAEMQRNELLRALKKIAREWDGEPEDMAEALAAIAKVEGTTWPTPSS